MRLAAALLFVLALAGCERPLVDPLDRAVEVVGVDLDVVQTDPALSLGLRVQGASAVTVDGDSAAFDTGTGVFSASVTLVRGINRIAVRAFDASTVVATDTLLALYLPIATQPGSAFDLPSPRTEAAVAAIPGNRVLVTGGVGSTGAPLASMAVLTPLGSRFAGTDVPLLTARAGHTASVLPDGGVLLVGGATAQTPTRATDFVPTVEWIAPGTTQSAPVEVPAGGAFRAGHTARVLEAGGRTLLYVYGGLVPAGTGVTESGTVDVFEWTADPARLARLSPSGGAGSFPALSGHVQVPLAAGTGAQASRATDVVFGGEVSLRFDFTAPGFNFPFDLATRDAAPLSVPRTDAAGAPLGDGFALVAGGRDDAGTVLGSADVYVGGVNRTFRLPDTVRLAVPRTGAGATFLPDGRILIVGGRTSTGIVSTAAEIISQ